VVLFSSGNSNSSTVAYPASQSTVIAVGATSSCDGETWWGSSYGSALDVVAPGVQVVTTDEMGGCGYTSGNTILDFNGTSSACPNAAGVVALILSADPTLTATAAQNVLQNTAEDQVGRPNEDTAGRDNFMGWGRVNGYLAVLDVLGGPAPPTIGGLDVTSGPQKGGTAITISGSNFIGAVTVTIGGASATSVVRVDSSTITCKTPASSVLGARDVVVTALGGSGTAPGAFSYASNPINLTWTGTPDQGAVLTFQVEGPANAKWALALSDAQGQWDHAGYSFCFSKPGSTEFAVLHRPSQGRLSSTGIGSADYTVPTTLPTLSSLYCQGLADDGTGTLVLTPCSQVTIF
jgi:hypothetical protein